MKTFNRIPNQINTSVSSYNKSVKYYNQLEWKGLVENKNIYDVDQNSQADAKNVYVDTHGSLVSRPPLLEEKLPIEVLPEGNVLVEVKQYSDIIVYVSKNIENHYIIVAAKDNTYKYLTTNPDETIIKYNLTNISNYIVCFNNLDAKVLDMNNIDRGWFSLQEIVEPSNPSSEIGNRLAKTYKEDYRLTNNNDDTPLPALPTEFDYTKGITMNIRTKHDSSVDWHFSVDRNNLPERSQLLKLAFKDINYVLEEDSEYDIHTGKTNKNILCIYKRGDSKVSVSFNYGSAFIQVPINQNIGDVKLMALSDDDAYCFVVSANGVYYLELANLQDEIYTWTAIYPWANSANKLSDESTFGVMYGYYHFITKDMFTFITNDDNIWFMGPTLIGSLKYAAPSESPVDNTIAAEHLAQLACCRIPSCLTGLGRKRIDTSSSKPTTSDLNDYRQYFMNVHDKGIKMFVSNGYMIEGASNPDFDYPNEIPGSGGSAVTKSNVCTIVINTMGDTDLPISVYDYVYGCETTVILPATQCTHFQNNTYAPLAFHNKFYNGSSNPSLPPDFTIISNIGNTYDQQDPDSWDYGWNSSTDSWSYDYTSMLGNVVNVTEDFDITASDYFTNSATNYSSPVHEVKAIRINNIEHMGNFSVTSGTIYQNTPQDEIGVWKIEGIMLLNTSTSEFNEDYHWYKFVYECGIDYTTKKRVSYIKLTNEYLLNIPTCKPQCDNTRQILAAITPYKIGQNMYYDLRSIFTLTDSTISEYDKLIKVQDEIWNKFDEINTSGQYVNIFVLSPDIELVELYNDMITIKFNGKIYTNNLSTADFGILSYWFNIGDGTFTEIPDLSFESNNELYLGFGNVLSITANTKDNDGNLLLNLPPINDQKFVDKISNMINISTTELAIFFENKITICSRVQDDNMAFGYRYEYLPTKLSTGVRFGDSVINVIEGTYTVFPTRRGLAFMNYQAFMSTTDQALEYITHDIEDRYEKFYFESNKINMVQHRDYLLLANGTGHILIYNLYRHQWWYWEVPENINLMSTDQVNLKLISNKLCVFKDHERYQDFALTPNAKRIKWFIQSQPLHMKAPNYYKNLKQLVFQLLDEGQSDKKHSITVQIQCYRKKLDTKVPELINFTIDELRTFVKRFNYWKINEVQYGLADDPETLTPTRLRLNGVSIKYEIGEEVR